MNINQKTDAIAILSQSFQTEAYNNGLKPLAILANHLGFLYINN